MTARDRLNKPARAVSSEALGQLPACGPRMPLSRKWARSSLRPAATFSLANGASSSIGRRAKRFTVSRAPFRGC